jgi:enterochelin esterase-like enzyme
VWRDRLLVDHNTSLFSQALLAEIMPRVEAEYRVSARREDRAIAGLSMGGLESLTIGLTHPAQFAYIGGFSSAVHLLDPATQLAGVDAAKLRLLWIACGVDDNLVTANRARTISTCGGITWSSSRRCCFARGPLSRKSGGCTG